MNRHQIIIDPEFQALIPPMSADSLAQLEANIRQRGLQDRLTIWAPNGEYILVDGYHRLKILKKLDEEPDPDDDYSFLDPERYPDRESVKIWILQNQIGRRNLTLEQRTAMVAKIVILRQQQSASVSKANLKQGDLTPEVPKSVPSGTKTVRAAAKEFDVPRAPLQAAVTAIKDNQPKPTECDICQAPFEFKGAMKEHRRKAHVEEMAKRRPSLRSPVVESQEPPAAGCSIQTTPLQDSDMSPLEQRLHAVNTELKTVLESIKAGEITDVSELANIARKANELRNEAGAFNLEMARKAGAALTSLQNGSVQVADSTSRLLLQSFEQNPRTLTEFRSWFDRNGWKNLKLERNERNASLELTIFLLQPDEVQLLAETLMRKRNVVHWQRYAHGVQCGAQGDLAQHKTRNKDEVTCARCKSTREPDPFDELEAKLETV
jgi:hypothetical protein